MPLIEFWTANPIAVSKLTIQQVVSSAGDGKLLDNSVCSAEFREYLTQVEVSKLEEYAKQCLADKFDKSGQALQDIVNEIGRRLDFEVHNGLYAGKVNAIGNDGLWIAPEGNFVVVEVKTTDAYQISLQTISKYRDSLLLSGKISNNSSILIVVGVQGTQELEAQVRGSRHAWDMRLVGVEALAKLASIKEDSDDAETSRKVRSLLVPLEYTRVDDLVEVVFTAAKDSDKGVLEEAANVHANIGSDHSESMAEGDLSSNAAEISAARNSIISALSGSRGINLLKKSRATFWTANHEVRVACTLSKKYGKDGHYWYAFHPAWRDFLKDGNEAHCVLGCLGLNRAFVLPLSVIESVLPSLDKTVKPDRYYWHLRLRPDSNGLVTMIVPGHAPIVLEQFALHLA